MARTNVRDYEVHGEGRGEGGRHYKSGRTIMPPRWGLEIELAGFCKHVARTALAESARGLAQSKTLRAV
jgi:hypothetical protein